MAEAVPHCSRQVQVSTEQHSTVFGQHALKDAQNEYVACIAQLQAPLWFSQSHSPAQNSDVPLLLSPPACLHMVH